ncbi:MAG: putative selenate ABC transporter substrate-binding protein [Planctomycetes bacterium]|nr:putative selenate ABC transporter substrate-binding protein [Planctomycetota bacterium]
MTGTRRLTRRGLVAAALGLAALAAAPSCSTAVDAAQPLRFTAIPGENTAEMIAGFDRVAAYLSGELGVPVEYVPVADYGASVEAFKNGDILLSWFGGLTGVQARQAVPGARAIAFGVVDPQYKSYFIANAQSGLKPSAEFPMELAGKRFTFGSASSTSGRMMPEYWIRQHTGKSPAAFFGSEMKFSGNHDATWQLVQDGTFDAGVLSYKTYETKVAAGEIDPAKCFVIWETPPYADYSWNAHPALDAQFGAGFVDKLQAALVGMKDEDLLAALMREEGLVKASNADFAALAELAKDLDLVR